MGAQFYNIDINTNEPLEFIDITEKIKNFVDKSKVKNGLCSVFSKHTTCAIKIGENEQNLLKDLETLFKSVIPENKDYKHNITNVDGRKNTHGHLRTMLLPQSETIPIKDSGLLLGNWQSIFFMEFDGPRKRQIIVEVLGE